MSVQTKPMIEIYTEYTPNPESLKFETIGHYSKDLVLKVKGS